MNSSTTSAPGTSDDSRPSKRHRSTKSSPRTFVTWNCNGLIPRCKWDERELARLLRETNDPDILMLQEVRISASSSNNRGNPHHKDYKDVKDQMERKTFGNYTKYWSLADSRYAGTLTLVRNDLEKPAATAFSPQSAIDLLLKKYGLKKEKCGIEDLPKKSESGAHKKKQTKKISSFFKVVDTPNKPSSGPTPQHTCEGRFQFLSFFGMDLINTYVPNHGTEQSKFVRREEWDHEMLWFVKARRQILQEAGEGKRRLLWCGDMNCARDYRDGTHWSYQRDGTVYEWWTDESKCFVKPPPSTPVRESQHKGMPSFTPAERVRFNQVIQEGELADIWRKLHPNGTSTNQQLPQWERNDFTWRGRLGVQGRPAKYQGRGQRLDYFLMSPYDEAVVERCEILGYGERMEGLFCGSDHCASILVMK